MAHSKLLKPFWTMTEFSDCRLCQPVIYSMALHLQCSCFYCFAKFNLRV